MLKVEKKAVTVKNIAFQFKFLGKDLVRYLNSVDVELPVYILQLKNYVLISSNVGWTTYALLTGFVDENKGWYVLDKPDTTVNALLKA